MWNNIGNLGNFTKILAEKAAAAAENIEGQLNESVGASPDFLREASKRLETNAANSKDFPPIDETAVSDDEDPFNEDDGFYKEDSFDVNMHDKDVNVDEYICEKQDDTLETFTENTASVHDIRSHVETDAVAQNESSSKLVDHKHVMGYSEIIPTSEVEKSNHSFKEGLEEGKINPSSEAQDCSSPYEEGKVEQSEEIDIRNSKTDTFYLTEKVEVDINKSTVEDIIEGLRETQDSDVNFDNKLSCHSLTELSEEDRSPDSLIQVASDSRISVTTNHDASKGQSLLDNITREETDKSFSNEFKCNTTSLENNVEVLDSNMQDISQSDSEESVYVSKEEAMTMNAHAEIEKTFISQIHELKSQLQQREAQLTSKSNQMSEMIALHEREKEVLETKLKETKEEAKKRISKAREKVDELKAKLAEEKSRANHIGSASNEQENIIQELRDEGEKLARKQSEMEQLVREARYEIRDLKNDLEAEKAAKTKAEDNAVKLERQLKETKAEISAAKQKLGLTDKLEADLLAVKEEREKKSSVIVGLEAKLKESVLRNTQLQKEMELALKEKVVELEKETSSIRNEKDSILQDLESKLRISEREASLREDSLRHEVSELRKRWQEAVRRCDGKFL